MNKKQTTEKLKEELKKNIKKKGDLINNELAQRIFQQAMEIWINPEIERRKKLRKIDNSFILSKAQIVFSLNSGNKVRLNDEVKAIGKCKINKSVKKGEVIYEKNVDNIESIKLTDEDINCAHITLLRFKNSFIVSSDARYKKGEIKELIERSKEFYESAKKDLKEKRLRPFYENCWNSAELSAVCHSLSIGGKIKGHGENIKNFVKWSELGNVDKKHAEILPQLNNLRSLKYAPSTDFKNKDHGRFLKVVEEMIEKAERLIEN